ncbi:hypothetical protein BATDEDRAFT_28249 [Batrachochytrium dendrobatidis JAM81]|uniref:Attractin/MKLN-like beta-propeller domain-containing protein n=1 Tax=Batrachochytrium dendrobatidis (strain JAM81 / FGSC 10211) TaxID=684364 RepID=F4PDF0_BATDJ|nr:uncharacterized protein BATDEDRAFT_28249 [Batrachochytrium dendrobatidis JAM81]EGF76668.1 hypothetical protein BATDEDRAFT_28249 [Batrachochytrium dendrobatidis JAM81]|eukprot:XP_006682603.1 hypothetical protein BATDEDRAFT_28249 [Batrachochytrium dendrobatidis JAM81]
MKTSTIRQHSFIASNWFSNVWQASTGSLFDALFMQTTKKTSCARLCNHQAILRFICFAIFLTCTTVCAQETLPSIPAPTRYDASSFIWKDSLVVYGGIESYAPGKNPTSSIMIYNFTTHIWSQAISKKTPSTPESLSYSPVLASHTSHVITNATALNLFGALNIPTDTSSTWQPALSGLSAFVYRLDLNSMVFELFKTVPDIGQTGAPQPRAKHASVWDAANGIVWVFGGYSSFGPLKDMWALKVSTGVWTQMPDSPKIGTVGSSMVLIGSNILLGCGSQGPDDTATNSFFLFDTIAHVWTNLVSTGPSPTVRSMAGMAVTTNESVLLFSGRGNNGSTLVADSWLVHVDSSKKTISYVSIPFDSANPPSLSDTKSNLPTLRDSPSVVSDSSGNIVMFGGRSGLATSPIDSNIHVFSGNSWIDSKQFVPGQPATSISNPATGTTPDGSDRSNTSANGTDPSSNGTNTNANSEQPSWITTNTITILVVLACCAVAVAAIFGAVYVYRARKRNQRALIPIHPIVALAPSPTDPPNAYSFENRQSETSLSNIHHSGLEQNTTDAGYTPLKRPDVYTIPTQSLMVPFATAMQTTRQNSDRTLLDPNIQSIVPVSPIAPAEYGNMPRPQHPSVAALSNRPDIRNSGAWSIPVVSGNDQVGNMRSFPSVPKTETLDSTMDSSNQFGSNYMSQLYAQQPEPYVPSTFSTTPSNSSSSLVNSAFGRQLSVSNPSISAKHDLLQPVSSSQSSFALDADQQLQYQYSSDEDESEEPPKSLRSHQ